ncbi:hypothetical protein OQA88_7745 [Cercophora sp. LCS_1]
MAETVGLAVGVAGLAGLFTACIDVFKLVETGSLLGEDFERLEREFENKHIRLLTWGRACGFIDAVTGLGRYGLEDSEAVITRAIRPGFLNLQRLVPKASSTKHHSGQRSSVLKATRWAISDKDKFKELLQHLEVFINDLEHFTSKMPGLDIAYRRSELIRQEVASVRDTTVLEKMAHVGAVGKDAVSHAATFRLCELGDAKCQPTVAMPVETGEWEVLREGERANIDPSDAHHQVLHRVSCGLRQTTIFCDKPTYDCTTRDDSQWLVIDKGYSGHATGLHLVGKREVNLKSYLECQNKLWWLIIQEYACCHETHINRSTEPLTTTLRLVPPQLCETMNSMEWLSAPPPFHPGAGFQYPFDWVYYEDHYSEVSTYSPAPWTKMDKLAARYPE